MWSSRQVAIGLELTQPQALVCLPLTRWSTTLAAAVIMYQIKRAKDEMRVQLRTPLSGERTLKLRPVALLRCC